MMLIMQILVVVGLGLVIYAVFGVFTAGKTQPAPKLKTIEPSASAQDFGKEQKIQRLENQNAKLESQLEEFKVASAEEKSGQAAIKEKEAEFTVELKRREEWVAKAETELTKIKAENADLNNKFTVKEKELEEEFTKNVNLARQMREIKSALEAKEMACRLKEDQLQAQKHQIESQLKTINEHLVTIAEFSRKEKISEWVPKAEFNQLNEEYTKLEKDLEANQERLKSFAAEIAHLRSTVDKKVQLAEEAGLSKTIPEEIKPEKSSPVEIMLQTAVAEKVKPEERIKLEASKAKEESRLEEDKKTTEENQVNQKPEPEENDLEKKTKETPEQQ
jgi:hypothetical protein